MTRRIAATAALLAVGFVAGGPRAGSAVANSGRPPGTNPFGPLVPQTGNCFTIDPGRSSLPIPPKGWYDLAISAPTQSLFTGLPKAAFISFTSGLEAARNDAASVDGFIGHTERGPQSFCIDPAVATSVYYQVLFDTTGAAPKPPGGGWAGGMTLYQQYGWSDDF